MDLKDFIRTIPDHPKPGIQFRDITTLLLDPKGLRLAIDGLCGCYADGTLDIPDVVVGIEARVQQAHVLVPQLAQHHLQGLGPQRQPICACQPHQRRACAVRAGH